ncbi:MAG: AIDA repeat-containing protein [Lentisphaeria bacterium]|nr:AIDA repeat-containing protein [Lentisphaeria bacterium]
MKNSVTSNNTQNNVQQIIYLDFDGEITSYNGKILTVDDVVVNNTGLSRERIERIAAELNKEFYGQNILFVTSPPEDTCAYSTIYVGKPDSFPVAEEFSGLAETVDIGNKNLSDNAFVFLDATSSDREIIDTITHEVGHLTGTLDHGGDGISRYAHIPATFSGTIEGKNYIVIDGSNECSCDQRTYFNKAKDVSLCAGGYLRLNTGALYIGELLALGGGFDNYSDTSITIGDNAVFYGTDDDNDGISNNGKIDIADNVLFQGCTSSYTGGAINNAGTINIGDKAKFIENCGERGGAIYNTGKLTIGSEALFSHNSNWYLPGDGGLIINHGTINIGKDAVFTNNTATGSFIISNNGTITIDDNALFQNHKVNPEWEYSDAGVIANLGTDASLTMGNDITFENNSAAAVFNEKGNVTIGDRISFTGNKHYTRFGAGAIYNGGKMTIGKDITFSGNAAAVNGGAVNNLNTITFGDNIIFSANRAAYGGAIYNCSAGQIYFNDTVVFSGNRATQTGGALYNDGYTTRYINNQYVTVYSTVYFQNAVFATVTDTVYNDAKIVVNGNVSFAGSIYMDYDGILENNGSVEFNIAERSTTDNFLINNWDGISGDGTFYINVAENQLTGDYKLVSSSYLFDAEFTIRCSGKEFGTISVDGVSAYHNNLQYNMFKANNAIYISVRKVTGPIVPEYANVKIYNNDTIIKKDKAFSDLELDSGETMLISAGGIATRTAICGGKMIVSSAGEARDTIIDDYGSATVSSGGIAYNTIVDDDGKMFVSSGGLVKGTSVKYGGTLYLRQGTARDTNVRGYTYISSGGAAYDTTVKGDCDVCSGGLASGLTISSGGVAAVYSGGIASNVDIKADGSAELYGGTISNVSIENGGRMKLDEGTLSGEINIAEEGILKAGNRSFINFAVAGRSSKSGYLINDISLIQGTPNYSITVAPQQNSGIYKLAANALDFNHSITITDGQINYGRLTINGGALEFNNALYYLTNKNGNLLLTVRSEKELLENEDNWTDVKISGASGCLNDAGTFSPTSTPEPVSGWVGDIDLVDYYRFNVTDNAKIHFTISASASAKFTIYELIENKDGTFKLKSRQSTTLKKDKSTGKYYADTKGLLLSSGEYYYAVDAGSKALDFSCDYTVSANDNTAFYTKGNNDDDWKNMKSSGSDDLDKELLHLCPGDFVAEDWVGFGDANDYCRFSIDEYSRLIFNLSSSDAAKFTVYELIESKKGTFKLKSLQSTTLKKDKSTGKYYADTKGLLLASGEYYYCMTSTNAAKGGDADYTIELDEQSKVFDKVDDGSDNWLYDKKTKTVNEDIQNAGSDWNFQFQNWVGFGDDTDFRKLELTDPAKVNFEIQATDAIQFTVWQLVKKIDSKGNISYSLKSLQKTSIKNGLEATTKDLLLDDGVYFVSMTSTNAAKGGDADFRVSLDAQSKFFHRADDGSNNLLYDKKIQTVNENIAFVGNDANIYHAGWVGFGDESDFFKFELTSSAKLSFDLYADSPAKFNIIQLVEKTDKKGNVSYSLKTLQSTKLKGNQDAASKELFLTGGTYYISMVSTGAKKGDDVDYSFAVNENSIFYPACNNQDDSWKLAETQDSWNFADEIKDWVGYGDTADFIKFEVDDPGQLSIELDDETAAAVNAKTLKLSCVDAKGKTVALGALTGTEVTSKKGLASGVYYIGVSCTKPKKTDVSYGFSLGIA